MLQRRIRFEHISLPAHCIHLPVFQSIGSYVLPYPGTLLGLFNLSIKLFRHPLRYPQHCCPTDHLETVCHHPPGRRGAAAFPCRALTPGYLNSRGFGISGSIPFGAESHKRNPWLLSGKIPGLAWLARTSGLSHQRCVVPVCSAEIYC